MRVAAALARISYCVCVGAVFADAAFWLGDSRYPWSPGQSVWPAVVGGAVIYVALGLAAYSQRGSVRASAWVLVCTLAAAALLVLGRGRDWYGSTINAAYYNQAMRLGSLVGAMGQAACATAALVVAGLLSAVNWARDGRKPATDRVHAA
jgi:hypothetical protein